MPDRIIIGSTYSFGAAYELPEAPAPAAALIPVDAAQRLHEYINAVVEPYIRAYAAQHGIGKALDATRTVGAAIAGSLNEFADEVLATARLIETFALELQGSLNYLPQSSPQPASLSEARRMADIGVNAVARMRAGALKLGRIAAPYEVEVVTDPEDELRYRLGEYSNRLLRHVNTVWLAATEFQTWAYAQAHQLPPDMTPYHVWARSMTHYRSMFNALAVASATAHYQSMAGRGAERQG